MELALSPDEIAEIEAAIAHARAKSEDFLELGKDDFPLPTLGPEHVGRTSHDSWGPDRDSRR